MSIAAGTVQVGDHVSTIPSRESGLRTVLAGVVTNVDRYDIGEQTYVDLRMSAEHRTITLPADALVDVR